MDRNTDDGVEIRLGGLVFAISSALDLISPEVVDHHLRVARIARAIVCEIGFSGEQRRDVLLAAALHDAGAFSLRERLDLMAYELINPGEHAALGYRLLKSFPHFSRAAEIVRHHHLPWDHGRGQQWRGRPVPPGSHVLHLADRVSVLTIDRPDAGGWGRAVAGMVAPAAGSRFKPEFVKALESALARPGFNLEATAGGEVDVREDPAFGEVVLAESDLRSLAHLFWQLVDFRSRFTATHTAGVAAVAGFLAPLAGVAGAAGRKVSIAASLHDLGKLAVPSEMLEKEKSLTRAETAVVRNHPLLGWRILENIGGLADINRWANFHHERLDGQGYPFRLPAARIPLESRIVAVADIFTALTEERPYRRGMSYREAVGILEAMAQSGAIDHDIVALVSRNRAEAGVIRRLAQEGASGRYRAFREPFAGAAHEETAA